MKLFTEWDVAAHERVEGQMVCGTLLKSGEPRYFLMSIDASDDEIRDASFQIREGRTISPYELSLLEQAIRIREMGVTV